MDVADPVPLQNPGNECKRKQLKALQTIQKPPEEIQVKAHLN